MQPAHVNYGDRHSIIIDDKINMIFYSFDYDTRYAEINMDFEHFHPFHEIMIPLGTDNYHYINGIPYALEQNDIVCLKPGLLHKTQYPHGLPSPRIIISFQYPNTLFHMPAGFSSLLAIFNEEIPIFRFNKAEQEILFENLNRIYRFSKNNTMLEKPIYQLMIHNLFTQFLYTLYTLKRNNIYKSSDMLDEATTKIYDICAYIHNHYQENLSLKFLAATFFISDYYLSHQFKKITGFTLRHYIQLTRIKYAQFLLTTSSKAISEIAFECGFESFSQFNRTFRKLNACSPSDYKKQHKSCFLS